VRSLTCHILKNEKQIRHKVYLSSLSFALISAQCVLLFLSAQVETLTEAQQAIVDLAFGQLAAGNGCYGQVEKVHNFKQQASGSLDHFRM
jgi:hypothetical protein